MIPCVHLMFLGNIIHYTLYFLFIFLNIIFFCGENRSRSKTIFTIHKTFKNGERNSVPTDMYSIPRTFLFKINRCAWAKFMAFKSFVFCGKTTLLNHRIAF